MTTKASGFHKTAADPQDEHVLVARATDFGRQYLEVYSHVPNGIMMNLLVFDRGILIDLLPFKANFLDGYKERDIVIQAVGSVRKLVRG